TDGRGHEPHGTGARLVWTPAQQFYRIVGDARDSLAGGAVQPFIADDSRLSRIGARHHRGVSRRGVGRHVIVVRLRPRSSIAQQPSEPIWTEKISKPLEVIVAKLVHHD